MPHEGKVSVLTDFSGGNTTLYHNETGEKVMVPGLGWAVLMKKGWGQLLQQNTGQKLFFRDVLTKQLMQHEGRYYYQNNQGVKWLSDELHLKSYGIFNGFDYTKFEIPILGCNIFWYIRTWQAVTSAAVSCA